jgi:hypothetical protein
VVQLDVLDFGTGPCEAVVQCLPTGACCLSDGSCQTTTAGDCAGLKGTYQGDGTSCTTNYVADGSFEAGIGAGTWTESSTNFGTPLCDSLCGSNGGTGPRTGSIFAWFGGVDDFEEGSLEQSLTIPAGAPSLDFYLEIPAASGNGVDFLRVKIDGTTVFEALENDPVYGGPGYELASVPLGAFADGGVHTLRFESIITGSPLLTNFAVDDISIPAATFDCPQCVTLDFETDDEGHPMPHGARIDTEYDGGSEYPVTITSFVHASGAGTAAILDSTHGPAAVDPDLLVGRGNILILQNDANLAQCPPGSGIYCSHNDDEDGGMLSFKFTAPVPPSSIVLIDIDAGDPTSLVVLIDTMGLKRTYTVPRDWTGDWIEDGPPGHGTLDLTTLADQPGFNSTATAVEQAGFDPNSVIRIDVILGGSAGVDDVTWCDSLAGG